MRESGCDEDPVMFSGYVLGHVENELLRSGLVFWHRFTVMYMVGIYIAWWRPGAVQRMALLRGPCGSWICSRAMQHLALLSLPGSSWHCSSGRAVRGAASGPASAWRRSVGRAALEAALWTVLRMALVA
jgi:hypothetical protein